MTDPKQLYLDVKIDKNKTLASFIECKSTELIISALKEFCMEDSLNQNFLIPIEEIVSENQEHEN